MNNSNYGFNLDNAMNIQDAFQKSCEKGDIEQVRYLLTSPELKFHASIRYDDCSAFRIACNKGHLEVVKYLLTSPNLKAHANIHANQDQSIILACASGNLDLVKYLLTSEELTEHPNIHAAFMNAPDFGLTAAIRKDYTDIAKFLLTSPELKEHADLHANNDSPFINACSKENLDLLSFFIFDLNIKKTTHIIKYLEENPYEQVEKWFKLRELNETLTQDLASDNDDTNKNSKKNKI